MKFASFPNEYYFMVFSCPPFLQRCIANKQKTKPLENKS